MRKFFIKKRVTAVLFIIILYIFSICNIYKNYSNIKEDMKNDSVKDVTTLISSFDNSVNENIIGKYNFIEAYGALNVLLDKKEENSFEVVKDNEGFLHNTYFATKVSGEIDSIVEEIKNINEISKNSGAEFLVTMPPDKFIRGVTDIYEGYPYNYCNENIDYYLEKLDENNIDNIDFRIPLINTGWDLEKIFYKTDHHWTTQASFEAYKYLVEQMNNKYGTDLDKTGYYTDESNYNFIDYDKVFLGAQGRKAMTIYSGLDNFTLIYPKFSTEVSFSIPAYDHNVEGRVEDVLINLSQMDNNKPIYEKSFYDMYLNGVTYPYGIIENKLNSEGPKVLVIRDSFASAPLTFFSSLCSRLDVVYPLYYKDSIKELIENGDYDYVIVMAYPGNLIKEFYEFKY